MSTKFSDQMSNWIRILKVGYPLAICICNYVIIFKPTENRREMHVCRGRE